MHLFPEKKAIYLIMVTTVAFAIGMVALILSPRTKGPHPGNPSQDSAHVTLRLFYVDLRFRFASCTDLGGFSSWCFGNYLTVERCTISPGELSRYLGGTLAAYGKIFPSKKFKTSATSVKRRVFQSSERSSSGFLYRPGSHGLCRVLRAYRFAARVRNERWNLCPIGRDWHCGG